MLGDISFAGKKAFNIKCDDTKHRILSDLQSRFGVKILSKHHDAYHAGMAHRLNDNPHLMCIRSNGNPYLLFLTRLNFVNQCIFIDKKIQHGYSLPRMIIVRLSFSDDLFEGTLLEGEMINPHANPAPGAAASRPREAPPSKWLFMFSDLIGYQGTYLQNHNTVRRLNMLYSMLQAKYTPEPCDVCAFQVKEYFTYDQFNTMLVDFIPNLPYTCRGIYFKPFFLRFKDVLLNFDDSLVVQTYRQKFKDTVSGNFLLTSDVIASDDKNSKSASSNGSVSSVSSVSSGPRSPEPKVHRPTEAVQVFSVGRTSTPDVYTLTDNSKSSTLIARIPDLATSKALRQMFLGTTMQARLDVKCKFCARFNKWVPMPVPHPR